MAIVNMPDLFAEQEATAAAARREAILLSSWQVWGWAGPASGEMCEIDECCPETAEGGRLYCYTELARLIELQPDGRWIAEIAMPEPWGKNGQRVLLAREWIGPPRRLIRAARDAA
jgi:hypothetical protein